VRAPIPSLEIGPSVANGRRLSLGRGNPDVVGEWQVHHSSEEPVSRADPATREMPVESCNRVAGPQEEHSREDFPERH